MGITKALTVYNDDAAGSATVTAKVPVTNAESMVVLWVVADSAASGDLGATTVRGYTPSEEAAPVLISNPLTGTAITAAARTGDGVTSKWDRYDVRGLEQVHLSFVNGAAGEKNLQIHVYLYG